MKSGIKNIYFLIKLILILLSSNIYSYLFLLCVRKDLSKKAKLKQKIGEKLLKIFPKLGPAFIKLGQVLSTRSDIIGEEVAIQLSNLQDKLPSFSINEVKKIFKSEFGSSTEELFKIFDVNSIAAASIAQVHKAVTKEGDVVAVKILRPKIKQKYINNLHFIQFISSVINIFLRNDKRIKIDEVINTLKKASEIELDLRLEGAAANKIKENCIRDSNIYIPKVYWSLTSKNVLTLEWIDGISIGRKEDLIKEDFNLDELTKKLAIIFFNQACRDGFFHADIHPGNILIMKNGDIALVDFGIVCYLDYELKTFVAEVVYGFLNKEYEKIKNLHFDSGFVPSDQSEYQFELSCRSIGEPIIGKSLKDMSLGKLLKHLFEVSRKFSVKIHPELLLLHKTILTIEGTGYVLNPKINMWDLASPWIKDWAKKNLGKKGTIQKIKYRQEKFVKRMKNILYDYKINTNSNTSLNNNQTIFKLIIAILIINTLTVLIVFLYKFFIN
ncbi:AarF/UbiB family protein [Candidatus Aquarickettsia rohweri]|uniref:2-polyprenylphenol 6-hydroxylase n=1 Tax=Candidatus Aquarickettsia rohweri TaxID=2602574 RepID=A0A3R9ZGB4_9RICK|nr:AarF/UbiB family protein [Candidatus Aquarickettsia rohweri]RST65815.1 2-polyprenylphenol 6-hydroxylase [Candidatus Aquarickettsia rohweri]